MSWEQYKPKEFEYKGKWIKNWFSNMVESLIIIDSLRWPSVENYYQAMKSDSKVVREQIRVMTPSMAKRAGRNIPKDLFVKDWESIKYNVMKKALLVKFTQPDWKEKLLATGDDQIIEWNNWGDKIWGVTDKDCEGQNLLGKALMEIREQLKTA